MIHDEPIEYPTCTRCRRCEDHCGCLELFRQVNLRYQGQLCLKCAAHAMAAATVVAAPQPALAVSPPATPEAVLDIPRQPTIVTLPELVWLVWRSLVASEGDQRQWRVRIRWRMPSFLHLSVQLSIAPVAATGK